MDDFMGSAHVLQELLEQHERELYEYLDKRGAAETALLQAADEQA
jgi:hypothetical protein